MNTPGNRVIPFPLLRVCTVLVLCLGFAIASPAQTNTIQVTTTNATGSGSLAAAINTADVNSGPWIILLQTNALYSCAATDNFWYGPNAFPPIANDITIEGNGSVIQRTASNRLRFFYVGADPNNPATSNYNSPGAGKLTLRHLTLTNGLAQGGVGGAGGAGMGGAVFNQGILILDSVTLAGNHAIGGSGKNGLNQYYYSPNAGGGGMGQDGGIGAGYLGISGGGFGGPVNPSGSSGAPTNGVSGGGGGGFGVSDNSASALGGGIPNGLGGNYGGNGSGGGGGGYPYYPSPGSNDVSAGPGGGFGQGGGPSGFYNIGATQYSGAGGGGGVGGGGGADSRQDRGSLGGNGGFGGGGGSGGVGGIGGFGGGGGGESVDAANLAPGGYGGGSSGTGDVTYPGGGGAGMGGAIFNHNGTLIISNSTLVLNQAVGGSGGCGYGAAVFNLNGSVVVVGSTIASNKAVAGVGGAAGGQASPGSLGNAAGGAIYTMGYDSALTRTSTVTIANSILAGTIGGADVVNIFPATTTAGTNLGTSVFVATEPNLIQSFTNSGGLSTNTGVITANPLLGPLANNGGPTPTMALLPGSPAANSGDTNFAPANDQRGAPRLSGTNLDLGAVQFQAGSAPATFTSFVFTQPGQLQLQFLGNMGAGYSVLTTTNIALPTSNWSVLGSATQIASNLFQFTDTSATNSTSRYYRLRQP